MDVKEGFAVPWVVEILAEELHKTPSDICQDREGSQLFLVGINRKEVVNMHDLIVIGGGPDWWLIENGVNDI